MIQIMKAGWVPVEKVCLSTSGYSMYPLLKPGSRVIVSTSVDPDRILIGDVVVIATQKPSRIADHEGTTARQSVTACLDRAARHGTANYHRTADHYGIMAHRVIFIQKRKEKPLLFLTKGDMNRAFDKSIGQDQILGKIVAIQKEKRLMDISKARWRIAGFLIAVSSGIFGLTHQWIHRRLLSCGQKKSRIGSWLFRLSFLVHRIFLYATILSLQ